MDLCSVGKERLDGGYNYDLTSIRFDFDLISVPLQFDCRLTPIRLHLRYDRSTRQSTCSGLLHCACALNK